MVLKESDFLNSPISLSDEDYSFFMEAKRIAKEWFDDWKTYKRSALHAIRYAESYIETFERDGDYAERFGEGILKKVSSGEFYEEMRPYAKYIGYHIYHLMKKFRDEAKANRTRSISSKRKETKRKNDAAKYLGRFKGYSREVQSQMDKMWDDAKDDGAKYDINSDEYKEKYDNGNVGMR